MKKVLSILTLALLIAPITAFNQVQRCHTDEYLQSLKNEDPQLEGRLQSMKQEVISYISNNSERNQRGGVITIPVVIHVMHNDQPIGTGANISEAHILSQIDVLNEDYRGLNADISGVPAHFSNLIADVGVEFCMAVSDPVGNPTTGIDRVSMGPTGTWSDNRKPGTIWDKDQYLNMWVAEISGGTLGYATFPGSTQDRDGVVIDYRYFGRWPQNPYNSDFDLGRTGTHEVGHWLGLEHIFQGGCSGTSSTSCATQGDGICDTPPTSSANYGCSLSTNRNTCTETPVDMNDMWMNYMDYMDDACLFMFSVGQADVMNAVLNLSSNNGRASIKSSLGCVSTALFSYSGQVIDASTGFGVEDASVLFKSTAASFELEFITDEDGFFTTPSFREGTYDIYAGKWGFMTKEYSLGTFIADSANAFVIEIEPGHYYDDFLMDFGWEVSGNASTGIWSRGIPIGTNFNGSNSNPGDDVIGDFGESCFVTGNGGGNGGDDDVDDGNTVLTSPVFDLTGYNEPYLSYYQWFFNDGGQGDPLDDQLEIKLSNGTVEVLLEIVDANSPVTNSWAFRNINVMDVITPTSQMQLIVETADQQATGHIVEAAIDLFSVVDSAPSYPTFIEDVELSEIVVFPNPTKGLVTIDLPKLDNKARLSLYSSSGQLLGNWQDLDQNSTLNIDLSSHSAGVYILQLESIHGIETKKVTLLR